MKIYLKLFVVITIFILAFSCEQDPFVFDVDCDECYFPEPDTADLILKFTINDENPFVPYVLYKGNIEEANIDWIDTAYQEKEYLPSAIDEFYSIKAFYKKGDQTLIVVDGDKLKTNYTSDVCNTECWTIKGGSLDLRIK